MPLTIKPDCNETWNDNVLTVKDGVVAVVLSIHSEGDDPHQGTTVSIDRKEFFALCEAYTRITPPTDEPLAE